MTHLFIVSRHCIYSRLQFGRGELKLIIVINIYKWVSYAYERGHKAFCNFIKTHSGREGGSVVKHFYFLPVYVHFEIRWGMGYIFSIQEKNITSGFCAYILPIRLMYRVISIYIYVSSESKINLVNNQRTLVPAGKKRLIFGWTNVKIFGLWIGILHCLIIADIVSSFNRRFLIEFKKQNYLKKNEKKMYPVWTIKSHSF